MSKTTKKVCALDDCTETFEPKRKNQIYCKPSHGREAANRRASTGGSNAATVPTGEVTQEEVLKHENRELRAAARAGRKGDVQKERLTRSIETALLDHKPAPRPPIAKRSPGSKEPHHRQLVMLSDWHGGEFVDVDAVNGLNDYSWEIMEERVDEVVAGLLSHKANSPGLTGLDIVDLGDMCSGHQHQELAETNEAPLAVQGVKMGYLFGQTIERLAPHYEDVRVVKVPGNHPRLKQKPAAKRVIDNMDWVAGMISKEYVSSLPNVTVSVPSSGATFWPVAGKTYYVWHGDGIKTSMPGVPWGGVMRRTNEIRRAFANVRIDGFMLGHYHQCNVMRDLGIYMNGALKGTDEWVLKNFGSGSPPCQLILTFDEKRSRLTDSRFLTPTAGVPS
jgi:hypothetical protein